MAEEGTQVVRLDGNGQPTFDDWNVAGPCSFGFCPVNFDDIEPGDQMWFGLRDADGAFGPIVGVPNVTEDLDSTWYRPQANRQSQNAGSVVETLYLRSFARWPLFGPDPVPFIPPVGPPIVCHSDCFFGDNRSFTTSTSVTSRITGIVKFRFPGFAIVEVPPAFSDPSMDVFGRTATGHPKPTIVTRTASGGLHIEIAGANPLVPAAISPDINTKLDLTGASSSGQVCYSGHLYGDAFPDSEVFVINSQKQPTMLHTFATTADRNLGVLLLIGDFNRDMGSFSGVCAAR